MDLHYGPHSSTSVAEVVLRLLLDELAPHALHALDEAREHVGVALVVPGAPDVARGVAHGVLHLAAARRASRRAPRERLVEW